MRLVLATTEKTAAVEQVACAHLDAWELDHLATVLTSGVVIDGKRYRSAPGVPAVQFQTSAEGQLERLLVVEPAK